MRRNAPVPLHHWENIVSMALVGSNRVGGVRMHAFVWLPAGISEK